MWRKKRIYIWVSMLVAVALGVSGRHIASVNAMSEAPEFPQEELLSFNMLEDEEIAMPQYEAEVRKGEVSDNNLENLGVASENGILEPENVDAEMLSLSNNKEETPSETTGLSDNTLPIEGEDTTVSENGDEDRESDNKPLDVVLPTDVPFDIVPLGEDGNEALIKSEQYCIENRSYEDVCISLEGVCSGNSTEDYEMSGHSVKDDFVQGKKNIWICLQWEDKEGKILEQPGIAMGSVSDPGKGEIILKAPRRNKKGEILDENSASKVYFSFTGDMKSDMEQSWGDGELNLDLRFAMKAAEIETGVVNQNGNPNILEHGENEE